MIGYLDAKVIKGRQCLGRSRLGEWNEIGKHLDHGRGEQAVHWVQPTQEDGEEMGLDSIKYKRPKDKTTF